MPYLLYLSCAFRPPPLFFCSKQDALPLLSLYLCIDLPIYLGFDHPTATCCTRLSCFETRIACFVTFAIAIVDSTQVFGGAIGAKVYGVLFTAFAVASISGTFLTKVKKNDAQVSLCSEIEGP